MISDSRQIHHSTDQLGRSIKFPFPPQRIISLVPSQTELLFDLGLDEAVVGITKFCIHPPHWKNSKTIVGGTKKFDFEKITNLNPDLIIGNKEENYVDGIDYLSSRYPVWMSDIYNLADASAMITSVGQLVGKEQEAQMITDQLNRNFSTLEKLEGKRVLYFIWRKPWMVAASNTFINDILARCGFINAAANYQRYPEVNDEVIKLVDPELILLSSEPYPFAARHIDELQNLCPSAAIKLVDGEMFSWYGSRLLKSVDYLNNFLKSLKPRA